MTPRPRELPAQAVTHAVLAELVANVLEIVAEPGSAIAVGDTVVVLESMKMEIPVLAERAGILAEISVEVGQVVTEGDTLAVIGPAPLPGAGPGAGAVAGP